MGASFQTLSLKGSLSNSEVKAAFKLAQEQDRYENGHCYSGGIGMADGLEFATTKFADETAAEQWLVDNAQKWEAAIAVRYGTGDGEAWLIGAWCAS